MDEQNKDNKLPGKEPDMGVDSLDWDIDALMRKSPRTKEKFVVEIDEQQSADSAEPMPYKGEIYFSNPPRKTAQSQNASKNSAQNKNQNTTKNAIKKKKPGEKKPLLDRRASVLYLTVCVLAVLVAGLLATSAISCANDVLAISRSGPQVSVTVPTNAQTGELIDLLHDKGLIHNPVFCKLFYNLTFWMKTRGDSAEEIEEAKPNYNSGVYYVEPDMGLEGMLNSFRFVRTTPKTVNLVFPEGFSLYQVVTRLDAAGVCDANYLYTALEESDFQYPFLKGLQDGDDRTQKLEGYLFPARYEFFEKENANSVIRRFLSAFQNNWTTAYQEKADKLGLTVDEVLILASIIQREAASQEQMAGISMVLHNRLKDPVQYPSLGCDATRDYVTNNVQSVLGEDGSRKYLESYDTYAVEGLPPGPICNPGLDAIEAALNPQNPDSSGKSYFYFQHDKSGNIYYAITLGDHVRKTEELNG